MRLFVEELTNLDFSYLDKQRGLVGETWLANIELEGTLDHQGMVVDFGTVKKTLRHWLDTHIDHKLLVPSLAKSTQTMTNGQYETIHWCLEDEREIVTKSPASAHCIIPCTEITPKSVASWCISELRSFFPESVHKLSLHFTTETIDGPFYHYTHGLKKHLGNCQRIAHGHRSRICIWENNTLSPHLMQGIADNWQDIYIGSDEDCTQDPERQNNYLFQYQAQQGNFYLSLPKQQCYNIPTETTVELIADHLACLLKNEYPKSHFVVKAFEGINKGAIAER